MRSPPFPVHHQLEGWTLLWAELEALPDAEERLAQLRETVAFEARATTDLAGLSSDPVVAAARRLFRQAGTDPTRYRPSSEALLRRLLKGHQMPQIRPLVDLGNCLSAALKVPCCLLARGAFLPPLCLRAGREGESYRRAHGL